MSIKTDDIDKSCVMKIIFPWSNLLVNNDCCLLPKCQKQGFLLSWAGCFVLMKVMDWGTKLFVNFFITHGYKLIRLMVMRGKGSPPRSWA